MARNINKNRVFRFNRRIRQRTNYSLRLKLLKSNMIRGVVRSSNKNMLVQFVSYSLKGDKVLLSAKAVDLKKLGYTLNTGNLVASYLTGYLAGIKAQKLNLNEEIIVDLGLQNSSAYGGRLYAAVKGIKDSGIKIRASEKVFPSEERLNGTHLPTKDVAEIIEKTKQAIKEVK